MGLRINTNLPAITALRNLGLNQRAIEATAFDPNGHAWISKLHYPLPCPRMEAQQSFMTVCGRLRTTHNDALDGDQCIIELRWILGRGIVVSVLPV